MGKKERKIFELSNLLGEKIKCGIIMPISDTKGYKKDHWKEVKNILLEAFEYSEYELSIVSDNEHVHLIHSTIIENLYFNEIIICDVSSYNANVMFELGLRLAFDKPIVIIKDEKTEFKFDISSISTIQYPSDLNYKEVQNFQKELLQITQATHKKSKSDPNYSPFLKHYSASIMPSVFDGNISEEIRNIKNNIDSMSNDMKYILPLYAAQTASLKLIYKSYLKENDKLEDFEKLSTMDQLNEINMTIMKMNSGKL